MTLSQAIHSARQKLSQAGIDDACIEAEFLVRHTVGVSKTQLYGEPDRTITPAEANRVLALCQRRLRHEPTAYILKHCEFYGIDFYIDQRVLVPRPETELLVEKAIESASCYCQKKSLTIADVGTGSGVIAISLALALPKARIYATDISVSALEVAEINCRRHKVNDQVKMLSPEIINFEPIIALAGGGDGLDRIRSLLAQVPDKICPGGCLLMEIGRGQAQVVTSIINNYLPESSIELIPDLSGIDRVVEVSLL